MKKKLFIGALALLSVFAMVLTSCDNDDVTPSSIEFKDPEFGHDNNKIGIIGGDIHLECDIVSNAKIRVIQVALLKNNKPVTSQIYDNAKYVGVLNTKFHEHLKLSDDLEEGEYTCIIAVTTVDNTTRYISEKIQLKKKTVDTKAPKITNLKVNKMTAAPNEKLTFQANIETTSDIKEIEVEFHGDKEHEIEINDLNGKKGKITFNKELAVPAECKPGTYHIHFTVKDVDGRETTEEIEDFIVK